MHNPEKNSPKKMDIKEIQKGLSEYQINKISYECNLIGMSIVKLFHIAPYLFIDKVTISNTNIVPKLDELIDTSYIAYDNYLNEWEGD